LVRAVVRDRPAVGGPQRKTAMAVAGLAFLGFAFLKKSPWFIIENDNPKKTKSSNAE